MSKLQCSASTSFLVSSKQHTCGSPDNYMTLVEQWAEIITRAFIMKHEISFPIFKAMKFNYRCIGDIMADQGWIGFFKRTGSASEDLVREFSVTLLDIPNIDALVWDITLHGVSFQYAKACWSPPCRGHSEQAKSRGYLTYTPRLGCGVRLSLYTP